MFPLPVPNKPNIFGNAIHYVDLSPAEAFAFFDAGDKIAVFLGCKRPMLSRHKVSNSLKRSRNLQIMSSGCMVISFLKNDGLIIT